MRIVVVTLPEKGHYYPLLGPAIELARRGHDVVMTATCAIGAELAAAGAPRVMIPAGAPPLSSSVRGEALARVLRDPVALAGWIRELLVDAPRRGIEPLRQILREVRPDVVAIDTMAYDGAIAAELEHVPWVGWATSLNPVIPDDLDSELVRTTRALPRRELFAEHGLDASFRVSDVLSPRGTATFTTEAFVGHAPAGVYLVGPSRGGTRGGERVDPAFAEGRPIIYVSFGSQAWHQPRRFARIFAAADLLGFAVIAAMGELAEPHRGHACVGFADQLHALRSAAAAITHGGAGSVMECLTLGVPMIVAPICNDQPHCARYVDRAGCGIAVDLDTCSDDVLVGALNRVITDDNVRRRSRAIADSYRRDGSVGAADLTEQAAR
jgi:MGT family glycosyltransferase